MGAPIPVALAVFLSLLLLLAFLAVYTINSYRRLSAFPGPPLAAWSYLWLIRASMSGRMNSIYHSVSKTYGPVARIGPNDLLAADPTLIRHMSSARSTYGKSLWYEATRADPYDLMMINITDLAEHDRLKAKTMPGYGGKENSSLEGDIEKVVMEMVDKIRVGYAVKGVKSGGAGGYRPLDLGLMSSYFTLDAITLLAYGRQMGFLSRQADIGDYLKATKESLPLITLVGEIPWLSVPMMHPWVLSLMGPKATDEKGMGKLIKIVKHYVSERFGPDAKDRKDMLGAFVRHGLTQRQCEMEAIFQIQAGSDTTATAMRATLLHLITNPRIYLALQTEIDNAAAAGQISQPITAAEADQLPYLQAVIWEGLRIHPPFTGLLLKQAPPEGDTLPDGRFIPGGTRIGHNTWAMTRNAGVFGPDAELFRPERWLEGDDVHKAEMRRTTELVFGYGRFVCSGKSVALLELKKVIPELMRNFTFELVDPTKPWTSANHNLFFQTDMWVVVTDRVH